jgi:hypothetical protein
MQKILLVYTALLFISFLTMFQLIELTLANPVGMYGPKPNYALVSIENPIYSSELSFTIKTNFFWQTGSNYSDSHCLIILDSNIFELKELSLAGQNTIKHDFAYDPYTEYTLKGTTPIANFTNLASGTHNAEVKYGYYHQLAFSNRHIEFVALGSATSQIILTQDIAQIPISSPSLTSVPNPSFSPTLSPTSSPTNIPPNSEPFPTGQAIAITASVTVATAGLFVFFKKYNNYAAGENQ